jgi:hypothetical protein
LKPLTVNGNPPGALVIWTPEVVQALNLSILMFPPFRYITYKNPSLPTVTLGKSEPPSRASRGAQVAPLSGEQVTLALPLRSLKAI